MSARQIAALLKSNRQDGWTNNNNNRNAHQVHNNNNVINTTMYPEQQLSAGLIGQNVQPAQFTNNSNVNVYINGYTFISFSNVTSPVLKSARIAPELRKAISLCAASLI